MNNSKDSLGDRMKGYENIFRQHLVKRVPVILRLDGKAFHTFTRHCKKPFDDTLMNAMHLSALKVMKELQGAKVAYVQSDEVSILLTDYEDIRTNAYFDYSINKLVSVTASMMTAYFNDIFTNSSRQVALFDCRAFNVPKEDVSNYFLWRAKDWERNSLAMYCQSLFSHKQLHKKNKQGQHDLLHSIGKNWTTDLRPIEKNGMFIFQTSEGMKSDDSIEPNFNPINELILNYL